MGIETVFENKQKRKVKRMEINEALDEGSTMTDEELVQKQLYSVNDSLLSQTDWRYEQLETISADFCILYGPFLIEEEVSNLKKSASFKFEALKLIENLKNATPIKILQELYKFGLDDSYPNIAIALRILLTLPVTTTSCERSFSKLKLVKNYLRSNIGQVRLTNLSIISIEYMISLKISILLSER